MKQYICPAIEAVELIGEHLMEASAPFVQLIPGGPAIVETGR